MSSNSIPEDNGAKDKHIVSAKKIISFAIPCYRSENTIGAVIDEIKEIVSKVSDEYDYEIVTVVDGSPDNVFNVLCDIAKDDTKVKVINLAKNYGQASAKIAALRHTTGDYIMILDDDGQCPVDRTLDLIEPLKHGADVVIADYPQKKQSLFKNFGSKINTYTSRIVLDVPKDFHSTNFYALKKFVKDQIILYKNPYPYLDGLISQTTKSIAYVPMEERERMSGTTGYTFKKLLGLWLNGFTAFSVVPLRISSMLGVLCAMLGFIYGLVTVLRRFLGDVVTVGWSSTISIMLFIGGLLMMMLGMIGEYIGRIYISINNAPQYVERETINVNDVDGQRF